VATGTSELGRIGNTGISGAWVARAKPSNLTVFGSVVLFEGEDTAGYYGLWVTGQAVGAFELTGISGANANGVQLTNFLVFGNEVLFDGVGRGRQLRPRVTTGTAGAL
jgi:hypothetical protein